MGSIASTRSIGVTRQFFASPRKLSDSSPWRKRQPESMSLSGSWRYAKSTALRFGPTTRDEQSAAFLVAAAFFFAAAAAFFFFAAGFTVVFFAVALFFFAAMGRSTPRTPPGCNVLWTARRPEGMLVGMRRPLVLALLAVVVACGSLKAADEGSGDAGPAAEDAGPTSSLEDAAPPVDSAKPTSCTPTCTGRTCGADPTCDASCGTCSASEVCASTPTAASCKAPTIVWEVDGTRVAALASYEAIYAQNSGTYQLMFPGAGRSVQIYVPANPSPGPLTSCPSNAVPVSLITSDNGWAGLDALPARWKNLIFTACGASSTGDVVTARDVTLTQASPARVAGTFEILVQGKGTREGSTLRVHGAFDVVPTVQ